MQLDTDFLDNQRRTRQARRRLNLAMVALFACIVMLGDLAAGATPPETGRGVEAVRPAAPVQQEQPFRDISRTFNFSNQTLSSRPR